VAAEVVDLLVHPQQELQETLLQLVHLKVILEEIQIQAHLTLTEAVVAVELLLQELHQVVTLREQVVMVRLLL
tara:strand:+ start:369 stop:587 length:219 start_codon:yes stop_codon:yes gene_type:complete